MAKRNFQNWLKAYVEYASIGEAPLSMIFWTGVSTIAGALRRQVWIDQKLFQWVPNFYIVFVAPPGVAAKTTTAGVGMRLLRKIDGINFGPNIVTWQALIECLEKSSEMVPIPGTQDYLTMSAITVLSSEFGTFLDPKNSEMIDVLVDLWDGKEETYKKVTKTNGSNSVDNPWINIIACTTPSWMTSRFPEYMIGGGFTSRTIFIYETEKRRLVAWPDEAAPTYHLEQELKLVQDLEQISTMVGEYELSKEVRDYGREWYAEHWNVASVGSEQMDAYRSRKQTHIMKLAMVLSAARSNDLLITLEVFKEAEAMITALEVSMPKVFARVGQKESTRGAAEIVDKIQALGPLSPEALFTKVFKTMSWRDFEESLASAINAGYLQKIMLGGSTIIQRGKNG